MCWPVFFVTEQQQEESLILGVRICQILVFTYLSLYFEGDVVVAHTGHAGGGRPYNSSQTNCLSSFQQISHLAKVPKRKVVQYN